MYGIIGAAVVTAAVSLLVIKRLGLRGADGQPLGLEPKTDLDLRQAAPEAAALNG